MPAKPAKIGTRAHNAYVERASLDELYSYAVMRLIYCTIALAHQTQEQYLLGRTRGQATLSRSRQIGQYLIHVGFSISFTQISRLVNRDRTSIAYACEIIEDLRDDLKIDKALYFSEIASAEMMRHLWDETLRPQSPSSHVEGEYQ